MSDAPKLLTEAEVHERLIAAGYSHEPHRNIAVRSLHALGLIAPEPVDPLDEEALALAFKYNCSDWTPHDLALAALRRGMELAQPKLTREMVRKAVFALQPGDLVLMSRETLTLHIHAALTEALNA